MANRLSYSLFVIMLLGCRSRDNAAQRVYWDLRDDQSIELVDWPESNISDVFELHGTFDLIIKVPNITLRKRVEAIQCNRFHPATQMLDSIAARQAPASKDAVIAEIRDVCRQVHASRAGPIIAALEEWRMGASNDYPILFFPNAESPLMTIAIYHTSTTKYVVSYYIEFQEEGAHR